MAKRRFRINAGRYGGEVTIGEINPEFVEYFAHKEVEDIIDAVEAWEYESSLESYEEKTNGAPPLTTDGEDGLGLSWHEISEFEQHNGAYPNQDWTWCEVPADGSDDFYLGDQHCFEAYQYGGREAYITSELPQVDEHTSQEEVDAHIPVLCFHSAEKGSFGDYFIETDGEDFDPQLLMFSVVETSLCEIIDCVWYNGVEVEVNFDFSHMRGKGCYASVGYLNPKHHDTLEKTYFGESYRGELWEEFWRNHREGLFESE